jgi:two-component system, cell cycle sensor histidine kinase and response regulator CckA
MASRCYAAVELLRGVLAATNGIESVLENHDSKVHLLLTDVVMPGMSGRDLAKRLLVERPDLRVLYTSGYTDETIAHHGVLETGMTFIQKPFTPTELLVKFQTSSTPRSTGHHSTARAASRS